MRAANDSGAVRAQAVVCWRPQTAQDVIVLIDHAVLTPEERDAVEAVTARQTSLHHVMRDFGLRACADIVTQDEYTHDILVEHGSLWLNYDTT